MKATTMIHKTVLLELSENEAQLLHGYMQNRLVAEESPEITALREDILKATHQALTEY